MASSSTSRESSSNEGDYMESDLGRGYDEQNEHNSPLKFPLSQVSENLGSEIDFACTHESTTTSEPNSSTESDDSSSSVDSQLPYVTCRLRKNKEKVKQQRIKRMRILEANNELLSIVSSGDENLNEQEDGVQSNIAENDNLEHGDLPREKQCSRSSVISANDNEQFDFGDETQSSETTTVSQSVDMEHQCSDDPAFSDTDSSSQEDTHSKPVCTGSAVTRASFEATFLAMSKKHNFSKSTRQDLLTFMKTIVPNPNIPSSNYTFENDIWRSIGVKYEKYEHCPGCNNLLHLETRICQSSECPYFRTIPSGEVTEKFFVIPIAVQLERILSENWGAVERYKSNHGHGDGAYKDICCGQLYRNLRGADDPKRLVSLVFHIDGAPAVKSKTLNLWPIQCFVIELPLTIRYSFKNILFCGLWCGTKKPLLQVFQSYFVAQIEGINKTGLDVVIDEETKLIHIPTIKVHGHIADLVAKAPSLNMKQFNGEFGCSICLHPGERINKGKGNIRVYPVYNDEPQRRNHKDTILHAIAAEGQREPAFGVIGSSPLHRIISIPDNILLDYMHLVLEGEFKRRLAIWLNKSDENGYLAKHSTALDASMKAISFPHEFNRKLRSLSEMKRWKDREFQNFFLHTSLPLLKLLLPAEYYHHFSLLVSGIWLLVKDEISTDDIELSKMLLTHYARLVEVLYGKTQLTYTVHALQHLPEQVRNFGPLILHSGFVFEAMISHLKRQFHGTRCIPEQIVKNLLVSQGTSSYIEGIGDDELKSFASGLITPSNLRDGQMFDGGICLLHPLEKDPLFSIPEVEALEQYFELPTDSLSFQRSARMIKNSHVFHSLLYRRRGTSCSFIVELNLDNENAKYGKVMSYLAVNNRPVAVVELYDSTGRTVSSGLQEPEDDLMKHFHERGFLGIPFMEVIESHEVKIVHCKDILRRCIFVPSDEEGISGYMCPVLKHYEHD